MKINIIDTEKTQATLDEVQGRSKERCYDAKDQFRDGTKLIRQGRSKERRYDAKGLSVKKNFQLILSSCIKNITKNVEAYKAEAEKAKKAIEYLSKQK